MRTAETTIEQDGTLRWLAAMVYLAAAVIPVRLLDALPVVCPFRRLTGLPCPGCGGTHAFVAMAHGNFRAAWSYNPLAVFVFALGLAWLARAFLDPGGRLPRLGPRAGAWCAAAFFAVAMVFGAWRILY